MGKHQSTLADGNGVATSDPSPEEYKVVVFGGVGVGKTCLVQRFLFDTFNEERVWRCIDKQTKIVTANGKDIGLHIWDTNGNYNTIVINVPQACRMRISGPLR